jgi:pimeloyl-ACP methyl ester carboxylesterase
MPAVFVHGVPETSALWDLTRPHLHRDDVILLQMPGFGCPRPAGFGATKEDYVAWLVGELEQITGPIDLVGHDWGGGIAVRLVSTRPDLVRSWVTDFAGIGHVDFEWHDVAKVWQTPGAGEDLFEQQLATPVDERGAVFELFGVPHDPAVALGRRIDRTMADCILALYRSAVGVGKEWAPDFHDIPKPGCVLLPPEDAFLAVDVARRAGVQAGAALAELPGLGHWWMLQEPKRCAAVIEAFWTTLS